MIPKVRLEFVLEYFVKMIIEISRFEVGGNNEH
jgi:hypothetical protein